MSVEVAYDCNACGACCAYAADWPALETDEDRERAPRELVHEGHIRWSGQRCAALEGEIGVRTRCRIYALRPSPCRGCEPGSQSCHVARRSRGLPVPDPPSGLDELLQLGASRLT